MSKRKTSRRIEPTFRERPANAAPRAPQTGAGKPRKAQAGKAQAGAAGAKRKPRKKSSSGGRKTPGFFGGMFWALKKLGYWGAVACLWLLIGFTGLMVYYAARLPQTSEWKVPKRPPNVQIVAANGKLLTNRGDTGGLTVRLKQLPPYLPQAVIAIEDRRFRDHFGVDLLGMARAVSVNLTHGRLVQGGSTLTQQLAKNLFLNPERTLERKMQEMVLSLWLEAKFTKNEIIEMYLNRVYFGAGAYGVDAAARRYFGKSARQVTVREAAMLAGLVKAPSNYAPNRYPRRAARRARVVLQSMHEAGFLTDKQYKSALNDRTRVISRQATSADNYVADWIMDQLPGFVGSVDEDIVVETTIDLGLQRTAEILLRESLKKNGKRLGVSQGALVMLDRAGGIKALIGGRDYAKSQFNRAVAARRQPGSAFKPFVYLAALEQGLTPETVRRDAPVSIRGWRPRNYTKKYLGPVTLDRAFALSLNTVAARLTQEVGPKAVVKVAHRLGVSSKLTATPSIALGTSEVSPLELTAAYVPFANGGRGVVPHIISSIRTDSGRVLYRRKGSGPGRVIRPGYVAMMNSMFAHVMSEGTGRAASLGERPAGGKTGTSQNFRDAWFVGFTARYVTGIWLGNDDGKPTRRATGGSLPASLFARMMKIAHHDINVADLPGLGDDGTRVRAPDEREFGERGPGEPEPGGPIDLTPKVVSTTRESHGRPVVPHREPDYRARRATGIDAFLDTLFGG